jgi:hypothetical protein
MAAFLAGVDQYHCFFLDFGDHLTLEDRPVYDPDKPFWLFPDLQEKVSASLPNRWYYISVTTNTRGRLLVVCV